MEGNSAPLASCRTDLGAGPRGEPEAEQAGVKADRKDQEAAEPAKEQPDAGKKRWAVRRRSRDVAESAPGSDCRGVKFLQSLAREMVVDRSGRPCADAFAAAAGNSAFPSRNLCQEVRKGRRSVVARQTKSCAQHSDQNNAG